MRMWILATALVALTSWPTSVRAQDLDSVTRCGGLVLAYASITFIESGDEDVLQRAYQFAFRSAYARHKAIHGQIPERDQLEAIFVGIHKEMGESAGYYGDRPGSWEVQAYEKIIRCYEELTDFMLYDDTNALTEREVRTTIAFSMYQAGILAEKLEASE